MKNEVTAVLFAGGKGTRLFPLNSFSQKVMMPIGNFGNPALEIVIKHLRFYGIENFIILLGYKSQQIKRYFGDGKRFGITIQYSYDSPQFSGTGGALYNAKDLITTPDFLVYFTDILTSWNFKQFFNYHKKMNEDITLWLDPRYEESHFTVKFNNDFMASDLSKHNSLGHINTGISLFNKRTLNEIDTLIDGNLTTIDLSKVIFPHFVAKNKVCGYISNEWWLDIGTIARYGNIDSALLQMHFSHIKGVVK